MDSIAFRKKSLRSEFRARLSSAAQASLAANEFQESSTALNSRLLEFLKTEFGGQDKRCWAGFQPIANEPNIGETLSQLAFDWVFPRVEGDRLKFYRIGSNSRMVANRWGILEPDSVGSSEVVPGLIHGVLVPGLAFDLNCNRLGRGGGYYDRALAEISIHNPEVKRIGVAFERQISLDEEIPVEPFDVSMHWIVTESRCFTRANEGRMKSVDASERTTK